MSAHRFVVAWGNDVHGSTVPTRTQITGNWSDLLLVHHMRLALGMQPWYQHEPQIRSGHWNRH